jgi:hypothetical protein
MPTPQLTAADFDGHRIAHSLLSKQTKDKQVQVIVHVLIPGGHVSYEVLNGPATAMLTTQLQTALDAYHAIP